ncbi:MAG: pilus assembly PilX N-terminal domain-containing protein [Candidatus Omnitrophota bacterium]|nr:pilus assembly PilX N-terminal domain-containing protein [Candidatus Omnitrophota bacterium]MDZ4242718.1 pilus assembly PilX N-terminal domain-containing protein [Candidatus Omnitrophota bacterium]
MLRNRKGSTLILAYMVISVLILLGAAFVVLSFNEGLFAERQRRSMVAFYIAEAGIERALYGLRRDFTTDSTGPSWSDGTIDTFTIGPDTSNYYTMPFASTSLNGGSYAVQLKNITGKTNEIWIQSVGTYGDAKQTLLVYAKVKNLSVWNNAIFAGTGASGQMINGNVHIRGSVHILGDGLQPTDYVVDLGGTAELIGNNYNILDSGLKAKVPALPTTVFGGETVETLNAELRVKHGIVGLSGASSAGEPNVTGNNTKETIDGSYVTNGFGGNQGSSSVYSDNGWSNGYDLGDTIEFPSLSDPYPGYATYQEYLKANALVIDDAGQLAALANITPTSNFSYSGPNGSISVNGSGAMTISGIVYVEGGGVKFSGAGINYSGQGSILSTGNVNIESDLLTTGNASFPTSVLGVMTPGTITFDTAQINVMGMFFGETSIVAKKQTDVVGTFVSNYFDMGTNVPAIFQVPDAANNLPPGLIGATGGWSMDVVSWQKI